jgi:hypothetical protein
MPLSAAQLDAYFTYHAPTEEQKPKYKAIDDAYKKAKFEVVSPLADIFRSQAAPTSAVHDIVNRATREFACVINEQSPDSADKTAAIRCVRLARNAANELYALIIKDWDDLFLDPEKYQSTLEVLAHSIDDEFNRAKWQSKSAIALEGKV